MANGFGHDNQLSHCWSSAEISVVFHTLRCGAAAHRRFVEAAAAQKNAKPFQRSVPAPIPVSSSLLMKPPVLIVPGWTNSGPAHWQSLWENEHSTWERLEQSDWDAPEADAWILALDVAVDELAARAREVPVLVGHSLGALLIAKWVAARPGARAAAALLVAPPDVERSDAPPELACFAPMPRARLPFPTLLAASRNDPYASWDRATEFAATWGSALHDCGAAGHLNTAAGYGPWTEGERLLASLLQRAQPET